jgi:predicted transcriptional regulator
MEEHSLKPEDLTEFQDWQIKQIEAGIREAEAGDFASDDEVAAVFAK